MVIARAAVVGQVLRRRPGLSGTAISTGYYLPVSAVPGRGDRDPRVVHLAQTVAARSAGDRNLLEGACSGDTARRCD